jgi:hypothetical protein
LTAALAVVLTLVSARASVVEESGGPDGFSICEFANSDIVVIAELAAAFDNRLVTRGERQSV